MKDDRDINPTSNPSRTAVCHRGPGRSHADQQADIAAFEAWQRLPRIGAEPARAAATDTIKGVLFPDRP
jgi:hypothetical protein